MLTKQSLRFALCTLLLAAVTSPASAARIYQLVNYPDLQNGHTVTGTITTTDNAPNDGLLDIAEILDWEWAVSDGLGVTPGQMRPTEPHSVSLTEVFGIEIDSQGVYLPRELGHGLKLEIGTNLNSRGANQWRLVWGNGAATPFSRYVFNGVTEGDIAFQAWGSDLPNNQDRWLVATIVPEPSGLILLCCVIVYAAAMRRGWNE